MSRHENSCKKNKINCRMSHSYNMYIFEFYYTIIILKFKGCLEALHIYIHALDIHRSWSLCYCSQVKRETERVREKK